MTPLKAYLRDQANYSHRRIINCGRPEAINITAGARAHVCVYACIRDIVARESRNVVALYRLSMACLLSPIGFTCDIPTYVCAREDDNGCLRIPSGRL